MNVFKRFFWSPTSLACGLAMLLAPVVFIEWQVLQVTHGTIAYPLDDTFIHLAVAKNLALRHTWGIEANVFSSASSSPLYTLVLAAGLLIGGTTSLLPLIINLAAAIIFVVALHCWLLKQGLRHGAHISILSGTVLLVPLPVLVVFGMEHTQQLLFCFLFITAFSAAPAALSCSVSEELPWQVYVYGMLITATRYESIFIVGIACLLLARRKRWLLSAQLGLVSLLPILLFGFYSLYKGSFFIPNSVLLKSNAPTPTASSLLYFVTESLPNRLFYEHNSVGEMAVQGLLVALPLAGWILAGPLREVPQYRNMLLLLTGTVLLHLLLATTTLHPIRYEAYLVGCSLPILGVLAARYGTRIGGPAGPGARWALVFLLLFLFTPLVLRSRKGFSISEQACINIYEQQYQMGRFLQRYYYRERVASGDIGALSYFTAGNILDLEGLGNIEVLRNRRRGNWGPGFLDYMCKKDSVKVAIVFDRSYSPFLRNRWKKVATWRIPNNVICFSDIVSFYAIDSTIAPELGRNLRLYEKELPREVRVQYY